MTFEHDTVLVMSYAIHFLWSSNIIHRGSVPSTVGDSCKEHAPPTATALSACLIAPIFGLSCDVAAVIYYYWRAKFEFDNIIYLTHPKHLHFTD